MAIASSFHLAVSLLLTTLIIASSTVDSSGNHYLDRVPTETGCQGSMADCMTNDGFDLYQFEISRRILQSTQYISYGAMQRNTVPCSRRGASYYNCQPGAEANPYSRGCSAITRCRS